MSDKLNSLVGCLSDYSYATNEDWDTLNELIEKAKKWGMIQWAVDEEIDFVEYNNLRGGNLVWVGKYDLERLERLYKEREQ